MLFSLQKAIMTRYNSASGVTLRADINWFGEDEAPSSVEMPYITFSIITSTLTQDFCNDYPSPIVQFSVFGDANNKSSSSVLQIADLLVELYKDTLLPMSEDYVMIKNNLITQRKLKDPDKGWQIILEFEMTLEKAR